MTQKMFKAIWGVSLIIFLGVFMYNYASLPARVDILRSGGLSISRDGVFYIFLLITTMVNTLVFVVNKSLFFSTPFRCWFYGLMITVNIFLIIGSSYVSLYNSLEKFSYDTIGFILYGSLGLIILWSISGPILFFFKKTVAQ